MQRNTLADRVRQLEALLDNSGHADASLRDSSHRAPGRPKSRRVVGIVTPCLISLTVVAIVYLLAGIIGGSW
jgi:hypothetical protein